MDENLKFEIDCLKCGKRLKCSFSAAGKKVKCPKCGELMIAAPFDGDKGAMSVPASKSEPVQTVHPQIQEEAAKEVIDESGDETISLATQTIEEPVVLETKPKQWNAIGKEFAKELAEVNDPNFRKSNAHLVELSRNKRLRYADRAKFFAEFTGGLAIACTGISVWFIATSTSSSSLAIGYNIGALIGSCFVILLLTTAVSLLADISASINTNKGDNH